MNNLQSIITAINSGIKVHIDVCRATLCCGAHEVIVDTDDTELADRLKEFVSCYIVPLSYEYFIEDDRHLSGILEFYEIDEYQYCFFFDKIEYCVDFDEEYQESWFKEEIDS
jgi:hypothetical protein